MILNYYSSYLQTDLAFKNYIENLNLDHLISLCSQWPNLPEEENLLHSTSAYLHLLRYFVIVWK